MEVLIWRDKKYSEIHEQDNPQMHGDSCIMVCLNHKVDEYEVFDIIETRTNSHHIKRAEVYNYDIAVKIANALAINGL